MNLRCLMVTRDSHLIGHVKSTLNEHGASLDLRQDSASAIDLASRRHWAGLVIDCDDVPGGMEAIPQIRKSPSNRNSLIFAVVNGSTVDRALDLGANFVLSKPVQEMRWRGVLHAALHQMQSEHRRYFRYEVDLPVRLENQDAATFRARMKNVSEGGLAIRLIDPVRLEGVVTVEFELPSINPQILRAKAEVVWSDAFLMGLRFLHADAAPGSALRLWLNSLEAQFQFRESSQPNRHLSTSS
jgi:CheY-like chemotaxis protein